MTFIPFLGARCTDAVYPAPVFMVDRSREHLQTFPFRFSDLGALRASVGRRMCALATVVVTAAPVAVSAQWWPSVTAGVATTIGMFWVTCATRVDMLHGQLPDAFLALAFLPIAMAAAVYVPHGSPSALSGIGYGAAVWAVPLLVAHLAAPAALGFGDVKAAVVIGSVLGLTFSAFTVSASLVVAIAIAVAFAISRPQRSIALGPFLALGAAFSLVVHPIVGEASR